jgi:broad specificity phosphatase PhoE
MSPRWLRSLAAAPLALGLVVGMAPAALAFVPYVYIPRAQELEGSGLGIAQAATRLLRLGQAEDAARYLAQKGGIAAVISSPLQRARDTATAAAGALGLTVDVDDDLIETDFGEWEGLTFSEAAERHPGVHGRWLRDTSLQPPGGESFDEVQQRVQRARDRIIGKYGAATVLVVSHVTPIKTLLRLALGAGPTILHRLHLDLASLSVAEFYPDDGASVRLVNDTSYLRRHDG